jgi:tRNA dimethylallyltransferase
MSVKSEPKVVVIVGPTASGKSALAIKMARHFNGEIISADSRQVYKNMDIGTGKVTKKEQRMAKHYLLDVVSPKREFNVSDFQRLGQKAIKRILAKGKTPIICGGTGFWIDALVYNITLPPVGPDNKLRAELEKQSAEQLFSRLKKLDPQRAKSIDAKNKRRLIRALDITLATGKPIPKIEKNNPYDIFWLGIAWPKDILAKRMKIRLDKRLRQGMINEVKRLIALGVSYKRLYGFGLEYRQLSEFIKNKKYKNKTFLEFKKSEYYNKLLSEITKYSKRQMTWFKRNKNIHWVNKNSLRHFFRPSVSPLLRRLAD